MTKRFESTEAELFERFFGTADLKGSFGTDDPVEILARFELGDTVGTDSSGGLVGFDDFAAVFNEIVLVAKQAKAKHDKWRRDGSLQFLAVKLGKTARQIREYCKAGLVPGAYLKGKHWRIDYKEDTVEKTRTGIGTFSRQRTPYWLVTLMRKWDEAEPALLREELMYPEKLVEMMEPGQYDFAAAIQSLKLQEKRVTVTAVAKLVGLSRPTVRKRLPRIKQADREAAAGNNPAVDRHSAALNRLNGKVGPNRHVVVVEESVDFDFPEEDELR